MPTSRRSRGFFADIGLSCLRFWHVLHLMNRFMGELVMALWQPRQQSRRHFWGELYREVHESGPKTLLLVLLVSFLVGALLTSIGGTQFKRFGLEVFTANLVGVGVIRALGPTLLGIVMMVRVGANYTAELAAYRVNGVITDEELLNYHAIRHYAFSRIFSLLIVMPFLALYVDFVGVLGGAVAASFFFDIHLTAFFNQLQIALDLSEVVVGLVKSCLFGGIVGFVACLYGLHCTKAVIAVGKAVNTAVVVGVVSIVVANSLVEFLLVKLGI